MSNVFRLSPYAIFFVVAAILWAIYSLYLTFSSMSGSYGILFSLLFDPTIFVSLGPTLFWLNLAFLDLRRFKNADGEQTIQEVRQEYEEHRYIVYYSIHLLSLIMGVLFFISTSCQQGDYWLGIIFGALCLMFLIIKPIFSNPHIVELYKEYNKTSSSSDAVVGEFLPPKLYPVSTSWT